MSEFACRACRGQTGHLVLDLGEQPACDYFPQCSDPGPDRLYPLQMWLCSSCGLAQLPASATVPGERRGDDPAALVAHAADAVRRLAATGLLPDGARVAEYGSPHGGSWLGLLADRGLTPVHDGGPADVVLDCFGMMHAADQSAALAERVARVIPGGVLLLQYHPLETIVRCGQWNALRHGHYAYYSTTALVLMLAAHGFSPRTAWRFNLYNGTVLLAAQRAAEASAGPDGTIRALLARDARAGVLDPAMILGLQVSERAHAKGLHDWLVRERSEGRTVLGYGAASRAVALLRRAEADRTLLPAVADASAAKQDSRMPGTNIPIVHPAELTVCQPDAVLMLQAELLTEVRAAFPEIEVAGGRWVDVDTLGYCAASR
jgi:C-methyltransferase C-terminal domain/Putative zinc binding domain